MFEFKFKVTEKDYLDFNIFHYENNPINKKSTKIIYIVTFTIFAAIVANLVLTAEPEDTLFALIFGIVSLGVAIPVVLLIQKPFNKLFYRFNIYILKKSGKLPFDTDNSLKFADDDYTEVTPDTESKIKYSKIEKVLVSENAVYIFTSAMQAHIIPLSAFENEQQKEQFCAFINQKMTEGKNQP
ncbi:MAG: YcxB family protein [Oscillospiraceae bacterium]|nr:YcxB family protein [Oscillospiraceae bacterium]